MPGLDILLVALAVAALVVGATGTWSPCGLSMVETIGPTGHAGGRPTTYAALATFAPGAIVGGAVTFGGLAWLGSLVHGPGAGGGALAYGLAVAIAIAAAIAEARGVRIVPQIRRQVPEHWRRVMPLPLASGLYGILLGLGFTTFVLSFGVWALAGIAFAVASPAAGLVIGFGFAVGRAIPILILAPVCERPIGIRARDLMTQSPAIYRGFRLGDAAALGFVAAAIAVTGPSAGAAQPDLGSPGVATRSGAQVTQLGAGNPGVHRGDLVFQAAGTAAAFAAGEPLGRAGAGLLRRGSRQALGGSVPAIGGPLIALRRGGHVVLLHRGGFQELGRIDAPRTDAIAISARWLVERVRLRGGDRLQVRGLSVSTGGTSSGAGEGSAIRIGPPVPVDRVASPGQIGRPSVQGDTVMYGVATRRASLIRRYSPATGSAANVLGGRLSTFTNPAVLGNWFVYVRTTRERQEVRLRRIEGRGIGRRLHARAATSVRDRDRERGRNRIPTMDRPPRLARDRWSVWTLDLAPRAVFATLITQRSGRPHARIVRLPR